MAALQDLIERVHAAVADGKTLSIRGGGTKDFYGEPPRGAQLSTLGHAGIVSYEPSELVVTVRAGTLLAELEALLAERGQCLPFEPPRFRDGTTVGGMVAAGLAGPARASVGAVRDYVLGAEMLNGRAELLRFGGTVMKNVAGYDVSRVLAGSLGVLGVITELSLKVLPRAPAEATLRFGCSQSDALQLLNQWGGQPLPLNASRWTDDGGGTLWLRLRGAVAAVETACGHLGGERVDPAAAADDWQACRDHCLPWFMLRAPTEALWRLSVPQTAPALPLSGSPLVEWHGGQRWYAAPVEAVGEIRAAASAVGGHATLFMSAAGAATAPRRFDALGAPIQRIHDALVHEFDPHAVFDRTRLFPSS
ncbi:FAD linked oxidase domain-containing protein [Alicycliphilus sp. B1]|nr:FAD linked oxidase domain-containing protein [Alicycliphilus sp. B1]